MKIQRFLSGDISDSVDQPTKLGRYTVLQLTNWRPYQPAPKPHPGQIEGKTHYRVLMLADPRGQPRFRVQYACEMSNATDRVAAKTVMATVGFKNGENQAGSTVFSLPVGWKGHILASCPATAAQVKAGVTLVKLSSGKK